MRQFPKLEQKAKLDDRTITEVMKKLFKNYKKWCEYLGRKSSLWLPSIQQEMAFELYGMLTVFSQRQNGPPQLPPPPPPPSAAIF
ncbi:hypothetical protein TIFTF001_022407 [Ficus carica]|uniref:Uncharacterized protein n=1 Tax=Ficus carica TaxID=3494 RepID=A0AA88ACH8_FICCA|nr:hypothetical protein TIFTF001_022407 [Ficus carica]